MEHDKAKQQDRGPNGESLRQGAAAAWPICLGYVPLGLAMGVLAHQAGMPAWLTGLMSLFLFAGSAQFIGVAMINADASMAAIVATTFMVNLRHALMGSALAVYLQGVNRWFLTLYAYGITDETFAVNMARFRGGNWDRWRALVVNHLANSAWVLSTVAGALAGQFIARGAFGIDYALTAMFICLLVYQLHNRLLALTGLLSAAIALGWYLLIPGNSYIVGASICGATLGFCIKRARGRSR